MLKPFDIPMAIKTLIVDDSVLYRKILSDAVGRIEQIECVGTASSGGLAIKKLQILEVDLVLLDVNMPEMSGLETLIQIKKQYSHINVILISGSHNRENSEIAQGLQSGAIDFIPKPNADSPSENLRILTETLARSIKPLSKGIPTNSVLKVSQPKVVVTQSPKPIHQGQSTLLPQVDLGNIAPIPHFFSILAVGVSTGGPEALNKFIPAFPKNFPLPVVLVQHMPPGFTKSLARSLSQKSEIEVCEASEGDILVPGRVYIAPGGHHMTLQPLSAISTKNMPGQSLSAKIHLNDDPPENSCRPAVDVLFRSVAEVCGDKGILSVILTGMGSDGALGVLKLKKKGCYSITQSEETCVVYGMPRAVDEMGLSDKSLPLLQIVPHILQKLHRSPL